MNEPLKRAIRAMQQKQPLIDLLHALADYHLHPDSPGALTHVVTSVTALAPGEPFSVQSLGYLNQLAFDYFGDEQLFPLSVLDVSVVTGMNSCFRYRVPDVSAKRKTR